MLVHGKRDRQRAYRAEIPLGPLLPLAVQSLVFQLRDTLFARSLVLLAMGFLAVHAAVLDEVAGLTVLELHRVGFLAAVGARVSWSHVEWLEAQLGSSSSPDRAVVKGLLSVWRLDTHGIFCICLHVIGIIMVHRKVNVGCRDYWFSLVKGSWIFGKITVATRN